LGGRSRVLAKDEKMVIEAPNAIKEINEQIVKAADKKNHGHPIEDGLGGYQQIST